MLQSIKRAWRLDSDHPHLHDCVIRFQCWFDEALPTLHPHVATVLTTESQPMVRGRTALQMVEEYLRRRAESSQAAALWGARALCRLLPERTAHAQQLATALHYPDLSIQGCVDVLESLREGDFGQCEKEIEEYIEACRAKYPYAVAFKPPAPAQDLTENHIADEATPLQPKEITGCVDVLESLREGDFGQCEKEIEEYIEACRAKYPYAVAFKPPAPAQDLTENHIADEATPLQPKEITVNN